MDKRKSQTIDRILSWDQKYAKNFQKKSGQNSTNLYARGKPSTMVSARKAGRDGHDFFADPKLKHD